MRNQPFNPFVETPAGSWHDIHARPAGRMMLLTLLFCIPLPVIAARVAFVQTVLPARFLTTWEQTVESSVPIPARDGRIVSRDGVVLAFDQPVYHLAVHYRWLESPPDAAWLKRMALQSLTRKERRDEFKVAQARRQLLDDRDRLWHSLQLLSGLPLAELQRRSAEIQQRVERMKASAERRRLEEGTNRDIAPLSFSEGLPGIWRTLRAELTTPPDRYAGDPLVLKEELQTHRLIEDVSIEIVGFVQSNPSRFPGVTVEQSARRIYPEDRLAAHVLGVRIGDADVVQRRGRGGIEEVYNSILGGVPGMNITTRDRRGNVRDVTIAPQPRDGDDAVLTLDARMQRIAEDLLDRSLRGDFLEAESGILADRTDQPVPIGGAIVIMDAWTGDLLVAASGPAPTQNQLVHPSREEWARLTADPRAPLFPRLTRMALAPGSVFKVITAAAALEAGVINADDQFFCRGFLDTPDSHRCAIYRQYGSGHGELNVTRALCESCHVYFFETARRLGPEPLLDWSRRFGLGKKSGVDLLGESDGHVPAPSQDGFNSNGEMSSETAPGSSGIALQLAIGQSKLTVTPFQVTRMMAAIANGGYLVTPRLLSQDEKSDEPGNSADTGRNPLIQIDGLSPETLAIIRDGLLKGVEDEAGTARAARVEGLSIAGITATAEVAGEKADHAWFAGYAPANRPRYVITVVLEHGGSGSETAAPIARELVQALAVLGLLTPEFGELMTSEIETRN